MAGLAATETGTWAAAAREFDLAVEIDSTFALAYYELSRVYSGWGRSSDDPKEARDYAEKAWALRDKLGIKDRLRLEAWRQELKRQHKDALATYREMLTRWPDDRQLISNFAQALFYSTQLVELVEFCRETLLLYPDDAVFHGWLAGGLGFLGRFAEALEASRACVRLAPNSVGAWNELGQQFLQMGLPDSAKAALQRSLEISPHNVYAQRYISYCVYYSGDTERAIELQNRILERDDLMRGERIRFLSGHEGTPDLPQLHAERGQFRRALELFDVALPHAGDREMEVIVESRRNRWLLRTGQPEEVMRRSRDLIDRYPRRHLPTYEPLECLGRAQVALDSLAAARSTVAKLFALAEQTGLRSYQQRALKLIAEIALAEGNPEAALVALQEMDQLGIYRSAGLANIEWRESVSRAHRMAGRLEEAARVHEELLGFCRGHALSHYELGQIYEEMNRFDDAEQEYATFLEMWSEADEGLPQVEDARARLVALRARP
jgi:tetratricopeptide (TPR) repeat protein